MLTWLSIIDIARQVNMPQAVSCEGSQLVGAAPIWPEMDLDHCIVVQLEASYCLHRLILCRGVQ